jgi:hypothetical protein
MSGNVYFFPKGRGAIFIINIINKKEYFGLALGTIVF